MYRFICVCEREKERVGVLVCVRMFVCVREYVYRCGEKKIGVERESERARERESERARERERKRMSDT